MNQKSEVAMDSLWKLSAARPLFDELEEDLKTNVLIIGGGISGILCAYMLKQAGVDYALVEAERICSGTSGRTTAKITLQHGLIYDKLLKKYGENFTRGYLNANIEALEEYRKLCCNTECDYEACDAFVYSCDNREALEREARAYEKLGYPAFITEDVPLPLKTVGAIGVRDQAQFNPMKLLFSLARELNIYEKTKVTELGRGKAIANGREIRAKKIIVTTHFPILNKHGAYFLKLYQHRSYVIALEGARQVGAMYVDEARDGLSFRDSGDILLLGGGSHRTGKRGGGWSELEIFAKKHYTGATVVTKWATQDCMSLDGVPYIGSYSRRTPDLLVATGYNKWGMTSAMVAARLLCDAVCEKENPYAEIFDPSRSILHRQLLVNVAESTLGLLTPTAPRCPHLGCALKYNQAEHSWDCSCHGSRFSEEGHLIDNPATDGMNKR